MKRYILAALLLASCGSATASEPDEPVSGVVSRMEYDDPDTWTESYQCGSIDMGKGYKIPTYCNRQHSDGPHWYVAVATASDRVHVIELGEDAYNGCRIGAVFGEGRCVG